MFRIREDDSVSVTDDDENETIDLRKDDDSPHSTASSCRPFSNMSLTDLDPQRREAILSAEAAVFWDDDSVSSSDNDEIETTDLREDDDSPPPLIPRCVSTLSDALKKINDLEEELRTLKDKLILAEDASKFHKTRCSELEKQLLSSTKYAQGQDAPQQEGANKRVGKVNGRCSTSNSIPKKRTTWHYFSLHSP